MHERFLSGLHVSQWVTKTQVKTAGGTARWLTRTFLEEVAMLLAFLMFLILQRMVVRSWFLVIFSKLQFNCLFSPWKSVISMSSLEMLKLSFSFCEEKKKKMEKLQHTWKLTSTAHLYNWSVGGEHPTRREKKHTWIFTSNSVSISDSTRYPVNLGSSRYCKVPQSK